MSCKDILQITGAVLVFLVVMLIGIYVADRQVNSLTLRDEVGQALAITVDKAGKYGVVFLGDYYAISSIDSQKINDLKEICCTSAINGLYYFEKKIKVYSDVACRNFDEFQKIIKEQTK